MPYNHLVLNNLLPDPGLPDNLKGKEVCSFPPHINIDMTAFMNVNAAIDGVYRKNTDDLTFIIPYATADKERYWALCVTIAWIISTTTAKIILLSAENEESFDLFRNPNNFAPGIALDWTQYSDPNFPIKKKKTHVISEIHLDICKKLFAGHLLKSNYGVTVWEDPRFAKQFVDRITVIVNPRKPGEPFHRTKYLNMMLDKVQTKIVCNHDADTLLTSHAISTSCAYIEKNIADVVYPYSRAIDSQKRIFFKEASPPGPLNTFILTGDMCLLQHEGLGIMNWPGAYGQSIFFKTESYKKIGGENEEFVSWAPEDLERYSRSIKLGLTVARVESPIVHIEHPRGSDSSQSNKSYTKNMELYEKLSKMPVKELSDYYKNAGYRKCYQW